MTEKPSLKSSITRESLIINIKNVNLRRQKENDATISQRNESSGGIRKHKRSKIKSI